MVRKRPCIHLMEHVEGRTGVEHDDPSDILQGEPDLVSTRSGGDVWAKRRRLSDAADHASAPRVDHHRLRSETGAEVSVSTVRRKDYHPRPVGHLNATD